MHTVQVSDEVKAMLDRLVADGFAGSASEMLELAVRRFTDEPDDEAEDIIAAAEAGIADMNAGRFTTIASQADVDTLREQLRGRAAILLKEMRANGRHESARTDVPAAE